MHDVVTVTVNYKMRDQVIAMLRSLYRDIAGSALRVQPVIVDNASDGGIAEAIAHEFQGVHPQPVVLASQMNVGFGRGNNLALRRFDARYCVIANPDLYFLPNQPHTIERAVAFLDAHPEIGILAPRLMRPDGSIQPSCLRFPSFFDHPIYRLELHRKYRWAKRRVERLYMTDVDHSGTRPIDWATGAALVVRGSRLREAGYFDERYFMYFEDCDLCRTFWSRGWSVYYKGDIVVQHGHERSSAKVPGLKSLLVNPLTRVHLASLVKYAWKWRGKAV
jgi:GT2 family glycosyltransferase